MEVKRWEVWYAEVPFEDREESKKRPVLVMDDTILCLKMTSQPPRKGEHQLLEWEKAGLKKPTVVRLGKVVRLSEDSFQFRIGKLSAADISAIRQKLRR